MKNQNQHVHPTIADAFRTLMPPQICEVIPQQVAEVKSLEEINFAEEIESEKKGIHFLLDDDNNICLSVNGELYEVEDGQKLLRSLENILLTQENERENIEYEARQERVHNKVRDLRDRGLSNSAIVKIMHG